MTPMRPILILTVLLMCSTGVSAQKSIGYHSGATSEQNLRVVANITPYSTGLGFDDRYQGVKGTPRLFDTLVASSLLIRGEEKYIRLESDLDVVRNTILFIGSNSGELREINSEHIAELIFHKDGRDLLFRTTTDVKLDKEIKENKFYEVLIEGPYQFIKIPDKDFVEADYQRVYSPDRRYDEFKLVSKYYILGSDSMFHRIQLTAKSLKKVFPDKKDIIDRNFDDKTVSDPEAAVIELLGKF